MKRIAYFIFVLLMCMSLSIPAAAQNNDNDNANLAPPSIVQNNSETDSDFLFEELQDDTLVDENLVNLMQTEGIPSETDDSQVTSELNEGDSRTIEPRPAAYALFSFTLTNATDTKNRSEDYFVQGDLNLGYLKIQGTLTSNNPYAQVGYLPYDGGFLYNSVRFTEVETGEPFDINFSQSDFDWHFNYYGYVQNPTPGINPYNGTIWYCNSAW